MSLISTVANYGGKQPTNSSYIKQFVVSATSSDAFWIYKRLTNSNNSIVQTPADSKYPLYISNDLYVTGSIFNISDIKLKTMIEPLSKKNIDELFNINPVKYKFISDKQNKIHYGFIAQEVEKIYPELISNDYSGNKSVNYLEMIPILLSKMKIMQEELDELKKKI